ncbi:alpha/beta hydrolase [Lactobacillus xylocopicola]|uniref:Alpha/beta hydrolase n=1 Tax=Lactobacillus xylocopicola TaxID=2976676 RepID=A0ABM8BF17_9LACO|nr:alpha/beta hydrolase [Lactobacillus xylocopicola]BDR59799.1 alpha/beta hydrolase [Lactobacillus xylocopicola]
MKIIEFGQDHTEVIILLHGGGLNWWNYQTEAKLLASKYHVVLPILPGHAGSDQDFYSIRQCAQAIIAVIEQRYGGSVLLIGGLSLGAQVAVEILALRKDICRYAIIESAQVIPAPLTKALLPVTLAASYGLIKQKWFARWQFRALKMAPAYFEDYYRDTCRISRQNLTAILVANTSFTIPVSFAQTSARVILVVGGKEGRKMRRSAALLHKAQPASLLQIKAGLYHGQFVLNHPREYAADLARIVAS